MTGNAQLSFCYAQSGCECCEGSSTFDMCVHMKNDNMFYYEEDIEETKK